MLEHAPFPKTAHAWLLAQRSALLLFLWGTALGALFAVREVLLPFGVALLLAYVLHPAVTALSALRVRGRQLARWMSTVLLYVCIFLVVWVLGSIFIPQVAEELGGVVRATKTTVKEVNSRLPTLPVDINGWLLDQGIPLTVTWGTPGEDVDAVDEPGTFSLDLREELEGVQKKLQEAAMTAAGVLASRAQGFAGGVIGFVFRLFLVLMLTAFMLSDVTLIRSTALTLVPAERRASFDALLDRMDAGLSGVVRGQLTICGVNAGCTLLGMWLLKVKFAFLLSMVAGVFSLIPIFGSIASSVPIVAFALTDGLHKALAVLAWIVGIHLLEANFLNPKILGSAAHIHPLLVVLSLITGEHFFGFTGALFAVPCLSVVLTLLKFIHARALTLQAQLPG